VDVSPRQFLSLEINFALTDVGGYRLIDLTQSHRHDDIEERAVDF
jgi:hypothetical protein